MRAFCRLSIWLPLLLFIPKHWAKTFYTVTFSLRTWFELNNMLYLRQSPQIKIILLVAFLIPLSLRLLLTIIKGVWTAKALNLRWWLVSKASEIKKLDIKVFKRKFLLAEHSHNFSLNCCWKTERWTEKLHKTISCPVNIQCFFRLTYPYQALNAIGHARKNSTQKKLIRKAYLSNSCENWNKFLTSRSSFMLAEVVAKLALIQMQTMSWSISLEARSTILETKSHPWRTRFSLLNSKGLT